MIEHKKNEEIISKLIANIDAIMLRQCQQQQVDGQVYERDGRSFY